MKPEKQPRGGKREGAGRPKGEETVTVRIPKRILKRVLAMKRTKGK